MVGINKVIRTLIMSDFFLHSGWGLINPIFAVFITQQIKGGIEIVGFAAAIYWITKSAIQPFLAHYLDITKGEKDDFSFLIKGMVVSSFIPMGYFFSTQVWHIFAFEFIRGIAMACVVPAWYGIFTRHIDKGWEAFSWSIQSTTLGFAFGFAAAFGGIMAAFLGFKIVFVLVTLFGLVSTFIIYSIYKHLFPSSEIN